MDAFAADSLSFSHAYANFAICSASRNSFLTGRTPDKTRVWNFIDHFRQAGISNRGGPMGRDWESLPQLFKRHGYVTLGHGKVYHPSKPPYNDEPYSWSQQQPYVPQSTTWCPTVFCPGVGLGNSTDPDHFSDYNTTMAAINTIYRYGGSSTPFFIALGLHFPHIPWATPRWAAEAYNATDLRVARHQGAAVGVPDIAYTAELDGDEWLRLNESNPILAKSAPPGTPSKVAFMCPRPGNNSVPLWVQRQLRQGYYSAVTHTDWLFGKVLAAVDAVGARSRTLVVLSSDHGWQLGEQGEWGKHTNFELALRVPLLMRAPWKPRAAGARTGSFTELLDLYRTVAAAAGLPKASVQPDVDGTDVSALLDEPEVKLKREAYAQYSRCPGERWWPQVTRGRPAWYLNNCEDVPAPNISAMGYTVRTQSWRLTEWLRWDGSMCAAVFDSSPIALELYRHAEPAFPLDFDEATETHNLAGEAEFAGVVAELRSRVRERFDTGAAFGCPPAPDGDEAIASLEA